MNHQDTIRDQFTRQAVPFSEARSMADADAIALLVDAAKAGAAHLSLDVACGPGMVALAFARVVRHAVGLDATPAMLDRARVLQARDGIGNAEWVLGDATTLPFPDASFDIVTCRFAVHHMLEPRAALREMARVARPGGRLVLCDATASDDTAKADAFNAFERMRDPSTVWFLTAAELRGLLADSGVPVDSEVRYRVPTEFESLMRTSFPAATDIPKLRDMMMSSIEGDKLGMGTRLQGDSILCGYPALILAGHKPT